MDDLIKEQFARVHDEETRQNKRIDKLESDVNNLSDIYLSIQKLAMSVEQMQKEIGSLNTIVSAMREKPIKRLDSAQQTIVTTAVGIIAGALVYGLFKLIGANL